MPHGLRIKALGAGVRGDDALHAVAVDIARNDAVDPNVVGSKLHRERLGEARGRPLGSGIRRPAWEAHDAGTRDHVDDDAALLGLEDRGHAAGAVKLRVDADAHAVIPLLVGDVLNQLGRSADTSVVDHDVEPAGQDLVKDRVECR